MKKKLFSILLSLAMVITMMPAMTMTAFADGNVAKIGEAGYATLQAAIDNVENGQTIEILGDFSYDDPLTINNGKTFTIDFENKRFTWDNEYVGNDIFTITGSSNVTVKDMEYKIATENVKGNRVFLVNSTGKLTLSNMICNSTDNIKDTPVRNNGGTVVIDGGNITTTNDSALYLLNPVVQNLGGTTTFKGNGTYTMKNNATGVAWLGNVITTPDPSADTDTNCGTVIIENGTFNTGHIVDVNGKGNVIINDATYNTGSGPIIKTFHGGIKSNITVNNITASTMAFAQVLEELNTKINFVNGNVKYTPNSFCFQNNQSQQMTSVSIKNGKFGPKSGNNDIYDEINNLLASSATLTALTGDPDGYTYKVEYFSNWSKLAKAVSGDAQASVPGVFSVSDDTSTGIRIITLLSDITAGENDSVLSVSNGKKVVLDLNGHVLDRGLITADGTKTLNDHGSVIEVYGELTINDSVPTTQHEGFVDSNGLWHLGTGDGTTKTIKGGIITGGTGIKVTDVLTQYQGGGIFINENGKVTMKSGTIAGNSVQDCGGGIMIQSNGEFTMLGGSITNNSAYEDGAGGGIYNNGTCKLNGGTITNNSATYGGGCANTGSCTLEKTTITDNNAVACGGGIYSYGFNSQLTVSGSADISIKGNMSTTNQGNNIATDSPIIINTALTNAEMYVTFVDSDEDETMAGTLTSGYINKNPGAKLDDFFHYDGPNTHYMDWNDGNTELEVKQVPSGKKAISIPSIPNGKVTADKQIAEENETVTLTVTPYSGYELDKLTYTYEGNATPIDITSTKSFTMPDKAVTITATFKESTEPGPTPGPTPGPDPEPTPSEEKYIVPVEDDSSVKVEATIENEKAKVSEITKKDLEEFVENTESKTNVDSLELDFTEAKQDVMGVEFTKPTLENVQEVLESNQNNINNLVVKMSEGTVSLDAKALEAVTEQANGDTIILVVDKTQDNQLTTAKQETLKDYNVNKTFEAYFESNGQRIHDFKGGVATVSMKFEPTQGSNTKNYKIYYLDDNAKMHKYATKYEKGMLVFATTHFSDYAIVYDGRVDVLLAQAKSSKGKIKLSWNGLDNITKYVVYGARCGHNYKKLKTTTGKSYTVKKASGKKLKAHKVYKFYVVAYDAVGNKISSRSIHCIYKNTQGKYANVKSIKAKYDELLLSVGVTQKISAKYKMYAGKKHLKKTHGQALKFFTNNTDVVTVSKTGVVKAVGKGKATIYIQDIGGKYCKTKVTVE